VEQFLVDHPVLALSPDLSPSAEMLAHQETGEETEYLRKLLETERQYYWNQFSEGLLSKKATNLLITAIERALDGQPKIAPRPSLEKSWAVPAVCVSIFATISGDSDLIFLRASSPSRILLAISFSAISLSVCDIDRLFESDESADYGDRASTGWSTKNCSTAFVGEKLGCA
jgi:hypothetical protein